MDFKLIHLLLMQSFRLVGIVALPLMILFLNPDTILDPQTLLPLIQKTNTEPDWKLIGIKQLDDKGRDTYPFGLFLQWWNIWPPIRSIQRLIGGKKLSKKEDEKSLMNAFMYYQILGKMSENENLKKICQDEANKYEYRNEFKKNSPLIYEKVRRHMWLDIICSHMKYKYKKKREE